MGGVAGVLASRTDSVPANAALITGGGVMAAISAGGIASAKSGVGTGIAGLAIGAGVALGVSQLLRAVAPGGDSASDPLVGAQLGTLQLADGGTATVQVTGDEDDSYATRRDAIFAEREYGGTRALVGTQAEGEPVEWKFVEAAVTRSDGTAVPLEDAVLYDMFVPRDASGTVSGQPWTDAAGDGAALAGFFQDSGGFMVSLPGEAGSIDVDATTLPPGT
jgi:hypothetical protein